MARVSKRQCRLSGARTSASPRLGLQVQRHSLANEIGQRRLVDRVVFLDVDGSSYLALEAGVEQTLRVLQRRTLEERQLDDALVGLTGADATVARPDRSA